MYACRCCELAVLVLDLELEMLDRPYCSTAVSVSLPQSTQLSGAPRFLPTSLNSRCDSQPQISKTLWDSVKGGELSEIVNYAVTKTEDST